MNNYENFSLEELLNIIPPFLELNILNFVDHYFGAVLEDRSRFNLTIEREDLEQLEKYTDINVSILFPKGAWRISYKCVYTSDPDGDGENTYQYPIVDIDSGELIDLHKLHDMDLDDLGCCSEGILCSDIKSGILLLIEWMKRNDLMRDELQP